MLLCGYAFEAIMFPTIFALSLRGLGSHTKRASSFLMMSPVGGVVGPLLMGLVADRLTGNTEYKEREAVPRLFGAASLLVCRAVVA